MSKCLHGPLKKSLGLGHPCVRGWKNGQKGVKAFSFW
jgi:hypothetical protein